ncbi:MAG: Ig domain-containing protein, partial [Bdellovibrio sp.]
MLSVSPRVSSGKVEKYSVTPNLPAGLVLNEKTGIISGTPLSSQPLSNYRIRAENSGGFAEVSVSLTVDEAPILQVRYSSPVAASVNQPILMTPTLDGGRLKTGSRFEISGPLPNGLSFDQKTGVVSGIPEEATADSLQESFGRWRGLNLGWETSSSSIAKLGRSYTVSFFPPTGSTLHAHFSLKVVAEPTEAPLSLRYSDGPFKFSQAAALYLEPKFTGGMPTEFKALSPLPEGIQLHPTTGILFGSWGSSLGSFEIVILAKNSKGAVQGRVELSSQPDTRVTEMTYNTAFLVMQKGRPVIPILPSLTGGYGTTFSIEPSLPPGLDFDPNTGVISGQPTGVLSPTRFKVSVWSACGVNSCVWYDDEGNQSWQLPSASTEFNLAINEPFSGMQTLLQVIEAETAVTTTSNSSSSPSKVSNASASGSAYVSLPSINNSIQIPLQVASSGDYFLMARVRSVTSNPSLASGDYSFELRGSGIDQSVSQQLPLVGDSNLSPVVDTTPGNIGSWVQLKSPPLNFSQGSWQLTVRSLKSNGMVDTISLIPRKQIIRADQNFQVMNDSGTYPIVKTGADLAVNGTALTLYDSATGATPGDKVKLNFRTSEWGLYRIGVRVRSGGSWSANSYFSNGYRFTLDGKTVLTMQGDNSSISAYQTPSGGGVYWGSMYSPPLKLGAGDHFLEIESLMPWGLLDSLIIEPFWGPQVSGSFVNADVKSIPLSSGFKTNGGVLAGNGKLYFAPYGTNKVLVFDPKNNTSSSLPISQVTFGYWSGGALGKDGKIYFLPSGSVGEGKLLQVNPANNSVLLLDVSQELG